MKKVTRNGLVLLILLLVALFGRILEDNNSTFPKWEKDKLFIYTIDVGQADSALILLPDGETLLIDAGNREDTALVLKFIRNKGIKKLDYVIATHPHEDHIGGMRGVIENFEIDTFYMPEAENTTIYYEEMLDALIAENVNVEFAKKGVLLKDGECKIEIMSPENKNYDDLNHVSAITKVSYKDNSFIFTGDAEKINEYDLIANYGSGLKCDVLKIGHHGSDTSSSDEFLEMTNPEFAVISVGKNNDYGHPHSEVKARLKKYGIPYYRTDLVGTVLFICDGESIEVLTERETEK